MHDKRIHLAYIAIISVLILYFLIPTSPHDLLECRENAADRKIKGSDAGSNWCLSGAIPRSTGAHAASIRPSST
jgi:hypothetical protein